MTHSLTRLDDTPIIRDCAQDLEHAIQQATPQAAADFLVKWGDALRHQLVQAEHALGD